MVDHHRTFYEAGVRVRLTTDLPSVGLASGAEGVTITGGAKDQGRLIVEFEGMDPVYVAHAEMEPVEVDRV